MRARTLVSLIMVLAMPGIARADQWITLNPPLKPEPRAGMTMEKIGGRNFLYGGRNNSVSFRDLWEFTFSSGNMSGTWTKLSPSGTPPASSFVYASTVHSGKLYIFSGLDPSFQIVPGVWSYDPSANAWSKEPESGDVPAGRWGHRVVAAGSMAYLIGGYNASGVIQSDVYGYQFSTGTWEKEAWSFTPGVPAGQPGPLTLAALASVQIGESKGIFPECKIAAYGGTSPTGPNPSIALAIPDERRVIWQSMPAQLDYLKASFSTSTMIGTKIYAAYGENASGLNRFAGCVDIGTALDFTGILSGSLSWQPMMSPNLRKELTVGYSSFSDGFDGLQLHWQYKLDAGIAGAWAGSLAAPAHPLVLVYFGGRDETGTFTNTTVLHVTDDSSADPSPAQLMATAAHLKGRGGVFYSSLFHLFNVRDRDMGLHVVYTPRQDVGGAPQTTTITIPARTMMVVDDPLGQWFGLGPNDKGVGTVMFYVDHGSPFDLFAQSIISAHNPDGTTYGQFLRAVMRRETVPEDFAVRFPTTPDVMHNRVNFAVAALRDSAVRVRLLNAVGMEAAAAKSYDLAAGESLQLNDVHHEFGVPYSDDLQVELQVDAGLVEGYESVLDGNQSYQGTSDPSSVGWSWDGSGQAVILEAGTITGLNHFTGSGTVTNLGDAPVVVKADFYERDHPGILSTTMVNLGAHESKGYKDLVGDLFGISGKVGTVMFTSQGAATIAAAGREYAVYSEQGSQTGTAGQYMRGLGQEDLLQPGVTYHVLGLKQTGVLTGTTRSHLSAMNPGTSDRTLIVKVYGAAGMEGQKSYTVRAGELRRINFILGDIVPSVDDGEKRLEITVDGSLFVQAFRLNDDGDPVTIDPFREYVEGNTSDS